MNDRRVLTYATDQAQAEKRLAGYSNNPTAKAEQVKGQWAVTAAKVKKEAR